MACSKCKKSSKDKIKKSLELQLEKLKAQTENLEKTLQKLSEVEDTIIAQNKSITPVPLLFED